MKGDFTSYEAKTLAKHTSIENMWNAYVAATKMQGDVGGEKRKAFFAGCMALFEFQIHVLGHNGVTEEEGEKALGRFSDELQVFGRANGLIKP